ncbi:hypothetical protein [Priestia megaterium]|uniref:hypothetical protein n=1 Tax=Priestia megaterium TaxID=1404 RepID=UPI002877523B|nr:hypothetical protein [Priestia megaterium]MBX4163202.1 hypothetical protein [Priestia megaterium]
MIGGQDEDSCGKSASDEEAHRPPAESEVLHGNQPWYQVIHIRLFIQFVHLMLYLCLNLFFIKILIKFFLTISL